MKIVIKGDVAYSITPFGVFEYSCEKVYSSCRNNVFMGYIVKRSDGGNMNRGFWKLFQMHNVIEVMND